MRIDASLQVEQSSSRQLGDFLVHTLQPKEIIHHDLAQTPPPPMTQDFITAMFNPAPDAQQQALLQQSDQWIQQLKQVDALLITTPMYNFGIPAHLKSFFDQILRAGHTFKYTENGPQGLLENKPVYLILSSGGDYREGAAATLNHLDGHLQVMLNFIGLTDLHFIHAAGLAQGASESILEQAQQHITQLLTQQAKERQSA